MVKKILLGLLAVFIIIQFIKPGRNKSTDNSKDITTVVSIPPEIQNILKTACYDCHSNNTNYIWYDEIQPVRWWVENHIHEGKQHLNFSEFATYTRKKQAHKIDEVAETIENDEMPLESYTIMHRNAKLTPAQKEILVNWATALYEELEPKEE
jgi:hypothetical protein